MRKDTTMTRTSISAPIAHVFDTRLRAYQIAKAKADMHCAEYSLSVYDQAIQAESSTLCEVQDRATDDLLLTQARDQRDLWHKIDIIVREEAFDSRQHGGEIMELLRCDARRLLNLCRESDASTEWDNLVARFEAVEANPAISDDSIDEAGDLIGKIMAMPAPHAKAARWKLDHILDTTGGSNASYEAGYIAQMQADYRRFLGDA